MIFSFSVISIVIFFPLGVYLKAFDIKLKIIFSNLSVSAHKMTGYSGALKDKLICCSFAR